MYVDEVVRVLACYKTGTLLKVIWDNNEEGVYIFDTMYDSMNGLEMDDPNFREYHLALLQDVNHRNVFKEVGSGENIPIYIEVIDTGEAIWDKRKNKRF